MNFEESIIGQYVKIEMEGYGMFASLSMVNLYEDTTRKKAGSFSFDREEANKIILEDDLKTSNWEYSLDGGNHWKNATGEEHTLTEEEVNQINGEDNILLRINEEEYVIDIRNSERPVITAYLNDLENRLIGMSNTEGLEWKIVNKDTGSATKWTSWEEVEPVVEGNSKLLVRMKARNIFAASEIVEFNFTADNQPDTRKYVPIANLSLAGVSAEQLNQSGAGANALDGNYNTRWLNSAAGTDYERYIIVKFDSAIYLSAMDYVPHPENGRMKAGVITGSMDGENYYPIATISGWSGSNTVTQTINFDESVKVRYVKIQATDVQYTNAAKKHMGARMFNFYEDLTKKEEVVIPTAEVKYSNTELTNQDVVVTLVNENKDIKILNNDGNKTYTFTENGEFTFEFEDSDGNKGSSTAKVDWIYKEAPISAFTYSTTDKTNDSVTVTINFPKNHEDNDITITNNAGKDTYTFRENGTFTFEFVDSLGNKGTSTAEVTWIEKVIEKASIKYDILTKTNQDVTAKFDVGDEEYLEVIGESIYVFRENGTHEFKYLDEQGHEQTITATVDWIDKKVPTPQISYSIMESTHQPVVSTISFDEPNVTVKNGNTYTFTENGEYEFEFVDEAGNMGSAVAKVDWIDSSLPIATITYSTTSATNKNVIATIAFDREDVTVKGGNTYTFTDSGEYEFEFTSNGRTGFAKAKVDWIDKVAPAPTVIFNRDITVPTKEDVTATLIFENEKEGEVTITSVGGNTHTFTANGTFTFEFKDKAGNTGSADVVINCIDKKAPTGTIKYNETAKTNQDVVATLETNEEVTITNNDGKNTYTFKENGTFTFEFVDAAGNIGSATAKVDWIEKTAPVAIITYSTKGLTNQDVIATVSFDRANITVDGGNTYTFTKNGTYTFEYQDEVGNTGMIVATVDWIDKDAPTGTIYYNTEEKTREPVIATLETNEEVTVTNNNGKNTYVFTENGEFTFEFVDKAGNIGTSTAMVDWINKTEVTTELKYSTTTLTNQNVTVTLEASEDITITNNDGKNTYTFTDNGTFIFEYKDKAGNIGRTVAHVDWIDKTAPEATISYSTKELTNQDVQANIVFTEEVDVLNENIQLIENANGSYRIVFDKNDILVLQYKDKAGNTNSTNIEVSNIDKIAPTATITYSKSEKTEEDVIAFLTPSEKVTVLNNEGRTSYTFTENGEFTFEFVDEAGNVGSMTAKVDWINKFVPDAAFTYNTANFTNEDVIVELVGLDSNITITNNNGSAIYVFTENGKFTFELMDEAGNIGSITASVDWIDKKAPTGTATYEKKENTVIAALTADEYVIITNNKGQNTYTFTENGEFTFEFIDKAGNKGSYTAKVEDIVLDGKQEEKPDHANVVTEENNTVETNTNEIQKENHTTNNGSSNTTGNKDGALDTPDTDTSDKENNTNTEENKDKIEDTKEKENKKAWKLIYWIPFVLILVLIYRSLKRKSAKSE